MVRNLMTTAVGLCSIRAVAGFILAVLTLILRDGTLLATTAAPLLTSPLALLLLVVIPLSRSSRSGPPHVSAC